MHIYSHCMWSTSVAVESHVANELVKEFKFSDTEKIGTEFSSSILARIYYLPKVMEEPR